MTGESSLGCWPVSARTSFKTGHLTAALVVALYVAIQSFAILGPFFPLDDLQELAVVNGMEHWWQIFGSDAFQLFRPVKNLIFAFFALVPRSMTLICRVAAMTIGCASFFPMLALSRRVFGSEWRALVTASVWLLAPTLVSSVAWLSCVNIQVMCAFVALTIALHDKAFDDGVFRPFYVVVAAVCLFLACASYEQAVVTIVLVVLFDFYLRPERVRSKKAIQTYAVYVLVTLVYLLFRGMVGSTTSLNGSFDSVNRIDIALASAYFTCQHFFVWLWPFGNMSPTGSYAQGDVSSIVLVACWLVVVALGVMAAVFRRSNPLFAFGIAFALVGFLPVSNILGFGNGPYGDYYMGIPSMGLSVWLVVVCDWFFAKNGRFRMIGFALGVFLIASRVFAVPEAARWAWLWSDGARAFESGIEAFPSMFANRQFYARICYENGQLDTLKGCCDWLESHLSQGSEQLSFVYLARALVALNVEQDSNAAMRNLDNALGVDKRGGALRVIRFYRGCVYEDLLNDNKAAEVEYRAAIAGKWSIDTPAAADRLARLLALRGEADEAEALWVKALKYQPDNAVIRHNLTLLRRNMSAKKNMSHEKQGR